MSDRFSVSIREAADMVGVSEKQIRSAINRLDLPARRLSERGRFLILVSDLQTWVKNLELVR